MANSQCRYTSAFMISHLLHFRNFMGNKLLISKNEIYILIFFVSKYHIISSLIELMIPLLYIPFSFLPPIKILIKMYACLVVKNFYKHQIFKWQKIQRTKNLNLRYHIKKEIAPCCLHLSYIVISFSTSNAKYSK